MMKYSKSFEKSHYLKSKLSWNVIDYLFPACFEINVRKRDFFGNEQEMRKIIQTLSWDMFLTVRSESPLRIFMYHRLFWVQQ